MPSRSLCVFTRDLRVRDNPALVAACDSPDVAALFVIDDRIVGDGSQIANRLQFLNESLVNLGASLHAIGLELMIRRGDWASSVAIVVRERGVEVVHVAHDGSLIAVRRVKALRAAGERDGFSIVAHPGITVVAPGTLATGHGTPYQVFTPFYRRWLAAEWRPPLRIPENRAAMQASQGARTPMNQPIPIAAVPAIELARGGETAGLAALREWAESRLVGYADGHDDLAADATSRISAYLHFGCLSPLEVATRLRDRPGGEAFARQLGWRDFFHQLLASRPEFATVDIRSAGTPTGGAGEEFERWCRGETGFPLVDAGMRQLLREGFMHNRVRMVVASFLTKDLDISWQLGARYFMEHLVDGDVANNQLNWQWVAGTGTDSNPHRIFNPTRQSQRFDPNGAYIHRYVPELRTIAAPTVHDPPDDVRHFVGYSEAMVNHAAAIAHYRIRRASDVNGRL